MSEFHRIKAPDGEILKFPINMSDADIEEAMGELYPEDVSVTGDAVKSGAAGFAQGSMELLGLPGTIGNVLQSGANKLFDTFLPPLSDQQKQKMQSPFTGTKAREIASDVTSGATEYEPKTTAGKYAREAGRFLPGSLTMGGANLPNALRYGVLPGLSSEAAGQFTEGTEYEPYARLGAAVLSPAAPALLKKAITPFPGVRPELLKHHARLADEGVDAITAGQKTGSKWLKYRESQLGGPASEELVEQGSRQFTRAALKRIGADADLATPEVLDDAYRAIGNKFNILGRNNQITHDPATVTALKQVLSKYSDDVSVVNKAPFVEKYTKAITKQLEKKNTLSGSAYQTIRSALGKKIKRGGPEGDAAWDIINILDDAMESGMAAARSPDLGKWREARELYKNWLVIERAAGGAGAESAMGFLSPAQLRTAAKTKLGNRNYVRGKTDLGELARSGVVGMSKMPDSGTGSRFASMVPGGIGGVAGFALSGGNPWVTAAGAAAPALMGRGMLTLAGRKYLGNQLIRPDKGLIEGLRTLPPGILAGQQK